MKYYLKYYFYKTVYVICVCGTWLLSWPFLLLGLYSEDKLDDAKFELDLYKHIKKVNNE